MHRIVLGNSFVTLVAPVLLYVLAHKLLNKRRASAQRIPPVENNYDVFLSFRDEDTRLGFTDHLYWVLADGGIHVYIGDDELRAGKKISPNLLETVKNSKILIPIISPKYSSSSRCLDELVHMMECCKRMGNKVMPIFYKVEPADVRHQMGRFGKTFHKYGMRFDQKVVENWKQALREVSLLPGWISEKDANGHEGELVKSIAQKVFDELRKAMELVVSDCLTGIDSHVEEVMKLVNKSSSATLCVGIYGMVGIGKTTLVKVIYNRLFDQFEHRNFIANIRESSKREGVEYLQNQFIFNILGREDRVSNYEEGIKLISSEFKDKKVLIFLDDVNSIDQLEALVGNPNWFALGSRIFITTRNKSVLGWYEACIKYELKEMDEEQSLILFCRHAFRRDSPASEFLALSHTVVSITGGFPLALEVVGSSLYGKKPSIWRGTIQKMQNVPHKAVQAKLRTGYDELEYEYRQMFLDIGCFLIGSDARVAYYMWDACDFFPNEGIEVLIALSLINIGDNQELRMQNQMRDLGRVIVHEESSEPHGRSRLWDYEEALKVLEGNEGAEQIEAICLEKGNSTRIADKEDSDYIIHQGSRTFTHEQFRNMPNLRFLHMSDVNLTGDFSNLFSKLIWLKWGNCPSNFEASNFHVGKLVILDLSGSSILDDWQGWHSIMMAKELKVLNLAGCRSLKSTFYLSAFKTLEILILKDCGQLEQIDSCIGDMETLISLNLSGCSCLVELPSQMGKLEQLKELLLDQTMIQEIPSFIGSLKKLEMLSAKDCVSLLELPDSIGCLLNLRCLSLGCCHKLKDIPNSIGKLELLTQLDLSWTKITELPESIGNLKNLDVLDISHSSIEKLPDGIGRLKKL